MKRFYSFVVKEIFHILRDTRSLLILIGMPIIQIFLFGYALTNEIKDAQIGILDHSKDPVSIGVINKLTSSGYFLPAVYLKNYSEIESVFKSTKVKEVVIFEPGFGKNLEKNGKAKIQIVADAIDPNTAKTLVNFTTAIIQDFTRSYNKSTHLPVIIQSEVRMMYNPELKGVFMFIPGLMALILMLISAMMTSISITREKELGTMEILLVSPLNPIQIILGKVIPYLILSFINAMIILSLGVFVFQVPIQGSLGLLIAECVLFTLMSLSLGILISTVSDNQQSAMLLSMMGLMLPTVLLSGFVFPIENMPILLQWLSVISPARWFIVIVKNIMHKGTGIEFIWKETLILLVMTLFFIIQSYRKFKIRLE